MIQVKTKVLISEVKAERKKLKNIFLNFAIRRNIYSMALTVIILYFHIFQEMFQRMIVFASACFDNGSLNAVRHFYKDRFDENSANAFDDVSAIDKYAQEVLQEEIKDTDIKVNYLLLKSLLSVDIKGKPCY